MPFLFGHHLNAHLGRHVGVVAHLPADNAELNIALLANVNALIEAFSVEQVALEADHNE